MNPTTQKIKTTIIKVYRVLLWLLVTIQFGLTLLFNATGFVDLCHPGGDLKYSLGFSDCQLNSLLYLGVTLVAAFLIDAFLRWRLRRLTIVKPNQQ